MKRMALLLFPLLVIPLIALSVLAWSLAGRAEDQLLAAHRERHVRLAASFTQRFNDEAVRVADALGTWAERFSAEAGPGAPPRLGQSWTLVFDATGRWWYPEGHAVHRLLPGPGDERFLDAGARERLAEAVRQEQSEASIDRAAHTYEELDRDSTPPVVRAQALLGLARCAQARDRPQQAARLYHRMMKSFARVVDETGLNFGAEAGRAYLTLVGDSDDAPIEAWRDYVDALVAGEYPMEWALARMPLSQARHARKSFYCNNL